jgi:CubicO group peptidase (beta-lactamase class C family)
VLTNAALRIDEMEQWITSQMTEHRIPGLALAIVQHQNIIYAKGFGRTRLTAEGGPVTPRTRFRIGSISKALTSTLIMQLVQSGRIDLDRPIRDYVPILALDQGAEKRITMRMLLGHTSGLDNDYDLSFTGYHHPDGLASYVAEKLPLCRLVAPPGKLWYYSNPGMVLTGRIAELVTGQPFWELLTESVLTPLGMADTTEHLSAAAEPERWAMPHQLDSSKAVREMPLNPSSPAEHPMGAATFSTVLDMANFAIMHLNQGRFLDRQVLPAETVTAMQTPCARAYSRMDGTYGLGFSTREYKGRLRVGHNGWVDGFGAMFTMIPTASVAVILMSNMVNNRLLGQCAEGILDMLVDFPGDQRVQAGENQVRQKWSHYVGSYQDAGQKTMTVLVDNGNLAVDMDGARISLEYIAEDLYGTKPGDATPITLGFVPEAQGPTQYLVLNISSVLKRV